MRPLFTGVLGGISEKMVCPRVKECSGQKEASMLLTKFRSGISDQSNLEWSYYDVQTTSVL